jgi:hypothetical protein
VLAYLRHAKPAPRVTAASKAEARDGTVSVNFAAGALWVAPEKHGSAPGPARLVFAKEGQALPLKAGAYRIRNYAIERELKGEYWAVSGSGPNGQTFEVKPGQETKLQIDPRVHLKVAAAAKGDEVMVCFSIQGDSKMGLSVLRGDGRVPTLYAIGDQKGKAQYG